MRLKNPPSNSCHGKLASSGERLPVVWEEEKAGSALGEALTELSCAGGKEVCRWQQGQWELLTSHFAPLSPPAIAIVFSQWEERKYLDSRSAEGCWCCCMAFWGGLSCRWAAGGMHRCRKGVSQELLRQWEIKLQQCIIFLLSAHPPKRLLPQE